MGYELEWDTVAREATGHGDALDARIDALTRRWAAADERLRLAQLACRALRGHVATDHPQLIGAQLREAQARHRRHELDLEMASLKHELEVSED
jgi:hypothetical protein